VIKITRVMTRPSTEVKWHFDPTEAVVSNEFKQKMSQYIQDGKCLSTARTFSEDNLTTTYEALWSTIEDYNESDTDPILEQMWAARDAYNAANGIAMGPVVIEQL
jgi:hypothetical protein